jgi:hypothetical protein
MMVPDDPNERSGLRVFRIQPLHYGYLAIQEQSSEKPVVTPENKSKSPVSLISRFLKWLRG